MDIKTLRQSLQDLNVLYVEDEEAVQKGTLNLLNKFFKTVYVANNGLEGVKLFEENEHIDVIISDIKMPKLDGFKMAQQLKQHKNELYLVFLTGTLEEYRNEVNIANDVIIKPLGYEDLINVLEKINQFFSK
jgi:CheY-like chemotaxis protein